jgi:hypothetical protein
MNRLRPLLPLVLSLLCGCSSYYPSGDRPGLGTAWGETRHSPVRQVAFDRDDASSPTAQATLRYDDRQGVEAMTGGQSWRDGAHELLGGALSVQLIDGRGAPLPIFVRGGDHFVAGRAGERYTIEIQNRSRARFEAVATVDGLDVLDGDRGSYEKRGYLIEPGGRLRIEGFRRSLADVAAFRFGAVADSYAARKGDDGNVGVIGVAFFCERGAAPPWYDGEATRRLGADPFPASRFATPPDL